MRSRCEVGGRAVDDILVAIAAIEDHVARLGLHDGLAFDAVRMRLIEIGEATNALDRALLAHEPGIPWPDIVGMRNFAVHRYFDTVFAIVETIVQDSLFPLAEAVRRLQTRV